MPHKYTMYRHGQCPKKQSFVIVTSSLIATKKVHVMCSVSMTELRPWPNNLRIYICCKCSVCYVQFRKQFAEKFLGRCCVAIVTLNILLKQWLDFLIFIRFKKGERRFAICYAITRPFVYKFR